MPPSISMMYRLNMFKTLFFVMVKQHFSSKSLPVKLSHHVSPCFTMMSPCFPVKSPCFRVKHPRILGIAFPTSPVQLLAPFGHLLWDLRQGPERRRPKIPCRCSMSLCIMLGKQSSQHHIYIYTYYISI